MKPSRWNIFARLTSRRQKQDASDEPRDGAQTVALEDDQPLLSAPSNDGALAESLEQETPTEAAGSAVTAKEDQSPGNEIGLAADAAMDTLDPISARDDDQQALASGLATAAQDEASADKPKRPRTVRPQTLNRRAAALTNAQGLKEAEQPAMAQPVAVNPFYAEVTELDEEVNQLRQRLAQKLRAQNDQLKKMLERFEQH